MGLPPLSQEQRQEALRKAADARRQRAELKQRLKQSHTTIPDVLSLADSDEAIGKMRVSAVLSALPGLGKVRAARVMEKLEISPTRRMRGLGTKQRAALVEEFRAGT